MVNELTATHLAFAGDWLLRAICASHHAKTLVARANALCSLANPTGYFGLTSRALIIKVVMRYRLTLTQVNPAKLLSALIAQHGGTAV
jgi:Na+/glutamate symporter